MEQEELHRMFQRYFGIFPWDALPSNAEGYDLGCGSGRWASFVAPRVGKLNCIDPSLDALAVARSNLKTSANVVFHEATANDETLPAESQDFGYSLGVLHHIPDTAAALRAATRPLKPGAPFLLYLYYRFDNRPAWFRAIWKASEVGRSVISKMPNKAKHGVTDIIAATVYFPLARTAKLLSRLGLNSSNFPLSAYQDLSFYTMRTDSRDRFGTPLEQRFTKAEITTMMESAGLERITFSDSQPFWVAVGYKRK